MAHSIFHPSKMTRQRLTFLYLEMLGEVITANENVAVTEAVVKAAFAAQLQLHDIDQLVARTIAEGNQATEAAAQQAAQGPDPATLAPVKDASGGFGADFLNWLGKQRTDRLCLLVADFDWTRARSLYCEHDIEDVRVMIALKTEQLWKHERIRYEACVYGFGGHFEGQGNESVMKVDMGDTNSVKALCDSMSGMGF